MAGTVGVVLGITLAWFVFERTESGLDTASTLSPLPTPMDEPEPTAAPSRSLADIAMVADDFERNAGLYDLIADASAARIEGLLGEVPTLPSTPHRYDVARVLYIRFAALDPQAAVDHVIESDGRPSWIVAVYRAWAHADLDAAVAHAATLARTARMHAMRAFIDLDLPDWRLEAIAKQLDGESMIAAIRRQEDQRRDAEDYASAWQSALDMEGQGRFGRLANLAHAWATENPVAAMEAAAAIDGFQLSQMIQSIAFQQWAADDASAATAWLAEQDRTTNVRSLTYGLMRSLTRQGITHAIAFIDTMPQHLRSHAEQGLIQGLQPYNTNLGNDDVEALINWHGTLEPARRHGLAGILATGLANHDPDRALDWVASIEGREREQAMTGLMARLASNDLAMAKGMMERIEDRDLLVAAARAVANAEAMHAPRRTLQWASLLPNESARIEAVSAAFGRWSNGDPDAATRELLYLPSGAYRDAIVARVAPVLGFEERFDLLEQLFESAESAGTRRQIGRMLYYHFTETDPRRAADYRQYGPES
ncbi:MAG: hypothetical protein F4X98_09485 [Gammaproteobacteria bacterium]|nr:hypothetical protein [Gammaproteobacteria bacterium]